MSFVEKTLSAFRRVLIVVAIAATFLFGLASTVYLSLRSPEVNVPDVVGKDRFEAENILGGAGLNFRVRATRASNQVKPDTVLFQLPRAGEVVKTGQTVAMDISRATKEGESSEVVAPPADEKKLENSNVNANTNANTNRPPRNKNANKNANENANANGNANTNRNANANRPRANENANATTERNVNSATGVNANRTNEGRNTNANAAENSNKPAVKPTPPSHNSNRDNP